jgi:hypothetical protein
VSRARAWLPWLVAAAILAALAARLPRAQILHAFATGPVWPVALCSAAVVLAALAADTWATLAAFAATGVPSPWRGVLLARGATYLLGLLNTVVGQGGMGVYLHRAGVAPVRAMGIVLFLIATQIGALTAVAAAGLAAQLAAAPDQADTRAAAPDQADAKAAAPDQPAATAAVADQAGATAAASDQTGAQAAAPHQPAAPAAAANRQPAAGSTAATLAASWPVVALFAAGFAAYLILVTWRPAWLARHTLLAPALQAGGGGFLRATAARLPQMLVMIVGFWLGLKLWGVELPLGHGLVVIAVVVLVTVLPVAPSGIGTMELAVVGLAAAYAPAATLAAQRASVLAFTLVYHLASVLTQAAIGLVCLGLVQRQAGAGAGRADRDDRGRGGGAG